MGQKSIAKLDGGPWADFPTPDPPLTIIIITPRLLLLVVVNIILITVIL